MYALNINKGTEIVHPDLGVLEAGIAVYIPDDVVHIAEHLRGVIVFERVAGIRDENFKSKFKKAKENNVEEVIAYTDFVKKYKDLKEAAKQWEIYKKEKGIIEKPSQQV